MKLAAVPPGNTESAYFAVERDGEPLIDAILHRPDQTVTREEKVAAGDADRVLYGPCATWDEVDEYLRDLDPNWYAKAMQRRGMA